MDGPPIPLAARRSFIFGMRRSPGAEAGRLAEEGIQVLYPTNPQVATMKHSPVAGSPAKQFVVARLPERYHGEIRLGVNLGPNESGRKR
jgi:hypothetical protein